MRIQNQAHGLRTAASTESSHINASHVCADLQDDILGCLPDFASTVDKWLLKDPLETPNPEDAATLSALLKTTWEFCCRGHLAAEVTDCHTVMCRSWHTMTQNAYILSVCAHHDGDLYAVECIQM